MCAEDYLDTPKNSVGCVHERIGTTRHAMVKVRLLKSDNRPEQLKQEMKSVKLGRYSIDDYPFGTLSISRQIKRQRILRRTGAALVARKIGLGLFPSPRTITEYWFRETFPTSADFFCCKNPQIAQANLANLLTHHPLRCIYVAQVTMSTSTKTQGSSMTPDILTKESGSGKAATTTVTNNMTTLNKNDSNNNNNNNNMATTAPSYSPRSQTIVGTCGDPDGWVRYKNRKHYQHSITTPSTMDHPLATPPLNTKTKTTKLGEMTDGGARTDGMIFNNTNTKTDLQDDTPSKSSSKKKFHSTWNLSMFFGFNHYKISDRRIEACLSEILKSKGLHNRVGVACDLAERLGVPFWVSKDMVHLSSLQCKSAIPSKP